ncbi:hypothetical protein L211DRAFT_853345 [Terfezia boudieri ATCC MYA-4762]|uniref:Uncharacterized protein n=1 Tax=Terfezia boudieri ATCC MYA-4762 TaxID=1051890 RepID=A0A3N4LF42_9PEZI|nr:hypothetical protein L211DRAFT_853345 [Terfezia boudieri ATCC MYA-4762]
MSESFYTSLVGEIRYMTPGTAEEAAETLARFERAVGAEEAVVHNITVIPDSTLPTPSASPSPQQQSVTTTTPLGPDSISPTQCTFSSQHQQAAAITTTVGGATPVKVEPEIGISEKPSRDSYIEGNSPICNLGASGGPLECSRDGESSTHATEATRSEHIRDVDSHMSNSVAACYQGLSASQHVTESTPRKPLTQEETKAEIRRYEAEMEAMIQKADANSLGKTTELSVVTRLVEEAKKRPSAVNRKIQRNVQRALADVGGFDRRCRESSRYKTPEEEGTRSAFLE